MRVAIDRRDHERASRDEVREVQAAQRVEGMMPGDRAIGIQAPLHERRGLGRPPAFDGLARQQREEHIRFAQRAEAAAQSPRFAPQAIGVLFRAADDHGEGLAKTTGGHAGVVNALRVPRERACRIMSQGITQSANNPRQIVRNGRGSMAHWRPPVSVTSL